MPRGYDSRIAAEIFEANFAPPSASQVYFVVQGRGDRLTEAEWLQAQALAERLAADPFVRRVDSVFSRQASRPYANGNRLLFYVTVGGEPASGETMDWLRSRERDGETSDIRYLIGGEAKYEQEVYDAIFRNLKRALLFIFAANFVVLSAAFRSVLLPAKMIGMNLLSIGASFGILAWLFERGAFGMEPGPVAIMIPVFIFGLVFGISMDYGVFLVSRIYEEYRRTGNNDEAIRVGLASTGRIITSAAAIMIAVTAPFASGDVAGVKQLGIGIAAAIFIDATVIRMILVPALMKWLGKWNWWAPG